MNKLQQLREEYRQSLKSEDTEETFDLIFYRPIGFMWACIARSLGITPNAITIASIFLGIIAGILFYYPILWVNAIGIALLVWANSFDSADGQLARMTHQYSNFGRILDGLSGDIWFITIYISICLRVNEFTPLFHSHHWLIWIIAIVAGISHAKQAAMADYYRQFHLYFVKGTAGSELSTTPQIDAELDTMSWRKQFWHKAVTTLYRHYTANQEVLTPAMQQLRRTLHSTYSDEVPMWFRQQFRAASLPLMKYTNLLTFNTRAFALFAAIIVNHPEWYFYFELTVLNIMLIYMMIRHEHICRKSIVDITNKQ
jgi:phosphatidylglycerophosphate synthase